MTRFIPALLCALAGATCLQGASPVYPEPREYQAAGTTLALDGAVSILIPSQPSAHDLFLARALTADLIQRHRIAIPTRRVPAIPAEGRFIVMGSAGNPLVRSASAGLGAPVEQPEGYVLEADSRRVVVAGADDAGAFYGMQSLRQLVRGGAVTGARIRDWPYKPFRGIKLYLPGPENLAFFKRFVRDFMALYKFNKMIVEVNAAMRLDRHPELNEGWMALGNDLNYTRRDRALGPGRSFQDSANADTADSAILEKADVVDLVRFASEQHIEVIPEIPTLTHSYYLLTRHRDLAEITDAEWPDTYCPSEPRIYDLVFDVIDEYLEVMQPRMVHVGHDEWRMPVGACPRCRGKSVTELFAHDVNRIYDHLKQRHVQVAMWGDHLMEPLRGKQTRHVANAKGAPYDAPGALSPAQVRTLIPKDILIFNWFWDSDVPGGGEPAEGMLREWGFAQVYGNLGPHLKDYRRRSGAAGMLGGAPSSWAATTEFNFGKDLMFEFAGSASLLWSAGASDMDALSVTIQKLLPDIRRRLTATAFPSDTNPLVDVEAPVGGRAVPVGRDVSSVIFLHAAAKPGRNRPGFTGTWNYADTATLLGWYEVVYEDGFVETVPLRYGFHILEAGWTSKHDPQHLAYAAELVDRGPGRTLFAYEWVNPRFGKVIREVRLHSASPDNPVTLAGLKVTPRRDAPQPKPLRLN